MHSVQLFFHLQNILPLSSGIHSFKLEVCYFCNCCFPLCNASCFSSCFPEIFFVFSFYKFGYYVSWCCFLWISSIWDLLISLNQYVYAYHQIWEIFSHYFFKYFSAPQSSFLVGFLLHECYVFCYFSMVPVSLFLVYFWYIVQIE